MDPYLEAPGVWPDVNHGLISELQATLNKQLRPRYVVRVEERVYISDVSDPGREANIADLHIFRGNGESAKRDAENPVGTTAVVPVEVTTLLDEEFHEARLKIFDVENREVVTVIEVVSPTNKIAGSVGRENYREKRRDVMLSPSHFVEIDLLRGGQPLYTREALPPFDYMVHVSRASATRGRRAWVWPISLEQRLPVIQIPLKEDDIDADVDLQKVLNTAFDRGAYELTAKYGEEPVPPLNPAQSEWARKLLQRSGPSTA